MYAVIIRPDPKFFKLYRGSYPLLVLSLGILMSVLLALIVHTSVHRRERMQKSLDEKTASLRKTVEMYGRMARNSSTVSLKIQQNAHFKDVSDSATAIFGYTPEEMEKLVTIPLEKQFNNVEDVKEIRSTSAENVASIVIEFTAGQDIEQAKQRVKDKVDLAKPDLPPDLDEPVVDAVNFS